MKLVRYGNPGKEKPGLIDDERPAARPERAWSSDIGPEQLGDAALAKLRKLKTDKLPLVRGKPRYGCPVAERRQVHRHRPQLRGPRGRVRHADPEGADRVHEGHQLHPGPERPGDAAQGLGQDRLGSRARRGDRHPRALRVAEGRARTTSPATASINDVSEREFQLERGGKWDKGKGCDTFGPIGPWLVTRDEVGEPAEARMWLDVNGKRLQNGNTRTMIFNVALLVSYLSQFMTLEPGDVITTGTPPGVGMGMKPPHVPQVGRRDDARHRRPGRAAPGSGAVQALIAQKN